MRTKLLSILILLIISINSFSQGTNNDFDFDEEDFNHITSELGFHTFKYPIKQDKDQLFDLVIEEFENGEIQQTISVIDETKKKFKDYGLDPIYYFKPNNANDSVFMFRVYFHHSDTLMDLNIKLHGVTSRHHFNFESKSTYSVRALHSTKLEIDSLGFIEIDTTINNPLMFLYANSAENKDEPLWCPAGIPKDKLIEHFYYVLYISLKKYEDE